MHKMAFAHVFGPEKKNGFGAFSYKFFVCIRVGLSCRESIIRKKIMSFDLTSINKYESLDFLLEHGS